MHRDVPEAGLFVGGPFLSKTRPGEPCMAISRRIEDADGRFAGVVIGTLRLAYFQTLFAALDLGPNGVVSLRHADGRLIARQPHLEQEVGRDLSGTPTFQRTVRERSGAFARASRIDGVERLYSFRHVGDLPLVLSVARSTKEIFAPWWRRTLGTGAILVVLCVATLALSEVFRLEIRRRLGAELALRRAMDDLAEAANTDVLTGIANRRRLDEVLEHEWRRAARENVPLSLLLLDLDQFKAFNDHYGHIAGDECLRAVARAVNGVIRRPADVAARYGGEELAVVLPNTEEHGALHMAERVRAAVQALGLWHAHNEAGQGVVTVSIGCATLYPQPGPCAGSPRDLVAEADCALYGAKHGGRNRVFANAAPQPAPLAAPARLLILAAR